MFDRVMSATGQSRPLQYAALRQWRQKYFESRRKFSMCWVTQDRTPRPTEEDPMTEEATHSTSPPKHVPWNKGKITGAKPPLAPKHVWAIRSRLLIASRTRDLAMFNVAIDSKLRGCDLVALKVQNVAPNGYTADRATVRQRKTGQPVK